MRIFYKFALLLAVVAVSNSCATFKKQVVVGSEKAMPIHKEIEHSFYLIGDAGNSDLGESSEALKAFKAELERADKNSTAIFLGDNIYPKGLPDKSKEGYELAKHRIKIQTEAVKNFKGETIFIPGNHDWYSGISGLKDQEKIVTKALGKDSFLPSDGCPIDKIHVSDAVELIIIDSHWYINNWNDQPTINDDCEIKTRQRFLDEFDSLIKKARGKTTIVAIHHPMYTNGSHGGQFSFMDHMSPLPILGTLKNIIRKTSGVANVDLQNKMYNELKKRLVTLAQANEKVVFVSGHEHNMQYLIEDNLHQIVSGSGSKVSAVRNVGSGLFGYAIPGYAKLIVYKDGSSHVAFFAIEEQKDVFQAEVFPVNKTPIKEVYDNVSSYTLASIYTEEETDVSGFGKFLWGNRYRKEYSTKVKAPNVALDTLFGGLIPVRKGGGNQSKSLRLEDKNGAQYVMRAVRKQALQYLQAVLFKEQYIEGQFDDTATENLILDVFTGSYPYAPLAVGDLADAIGVYHTNPVLYYVPKQERLGEYNDEFGDELYMIEEHTSEGHSDKASFGFQNELVSTEDMMKKIHKDEDIIVDETAYIKARLFDMLIGDWDRHQDQWRWIEFEENGKDIYRPMPRDRDQAFSIMSDGFLLGAAVKLMPTARLLRAYSEDLEDVKGVNAEPYPLDKEIITQSGKEIWDAQVKLIQQNITDEIIEKAFFNIPDEMPNASIDEIKRTLKARRDNLQKISNRYYELINKYAVIKGTNKDDWFDVERMPNGETKVTAYRIKGDEKTDKFHERTYNSDDTKEIWIYALDDDDVFNITGDGDDFIKLRLIGGQNNDKYVIENGKRVTYYDYKSKKNTIVTNKGHKKFTDDYKTNVYDYKKLKNSTNQLIPSIGANPDDGFKMGFVNAYTTYGFERNPFTSKHQLAASYYFATQGFDVNYKGEFANVIGRFNLGLEVHFTSPNYAFNFFGFGNDSSNPEEDENDGLDVNMDYNRVKLETLKFAPTLIWNGRYGASFEFGLTYESIEVEDTNERFINQFIGDNAEIKNNYYGADAKYQFSNSDNEAFPTLGMLFSLQSGYRNNTDTKKGFGYVISEFGVDYKLVPSGQLILASKLRGHFNLGDNFEFYQGATIGADNGLRAFRNNRFNGKSAFVQSTDLRLNVKKVKTSVLPLHMGFYGGFDYGRVWLDNEDSDTWHTSLGGGIYAIAADMMTLNLSAFNSDEGMRFAFKLGFGF
ncbi:metallophosphoesterase [Winogradskyella thalassocola]|uniref:Calcineurin-like phosphoesterase n=1 Tax=Winogradskyella thalassocola TaxID=262004 RepID=A0A1G7YCM7_9FLAO|nr:metallophosphoesterase [Winogradskyella thalassocola]SDG94097.1 Calcineurin-like phosphoesterase [Winogradskyella thalassocola]